MKFLIFLIPFVYSQLDKIYRVDEFLNTTNYVRKLANLRSSDIKTNVDWVDLNKVTSTEIGQVGGTCWLWSAISTLETNFAISRNILTPLSKQFILDCNMNDWGEHWTCRGGRYDSVFQYVIKKGIYREIDYPWVGCDNKCSFLNNTYGYLSGYNVLQPLNNELLRQYLNRGTLAGLIDLSYTKNGNIANCISNDKLFMNHAVQIVGYGIENNTPYFKIKNSWGSGWEDNGYLKINATDENVCGINVYAIYPIVEPIKTVQPSIKPTILPTIKPIPVYNSCSCIQCTCI